MLLDDFFIDNVRITITVTFREGVIQYKWKNNPFIQFRWFINCKQFFQRQIPYNENISKWSIL